MRSVAKSRPIPATSSRTADWPGSSLLDSGILAAIRAAPAPLTAPATKGAHRIRGGFDWNVNDVQQSREDNIQGRYDYKSLTDYIAGKISRYRQTVLTFNPDDPGFKGRQRELAAYVQDKISLGDNVTATVGLR